MRPGRVLGAAAVAVALAVPAAGAYPVHRGEIVFDVENGVFLGAYHPADFSPADVRFTLRSVCEGGELRHYKENRGSDGFLVFTSSCASLKATVPDRVRVKARRDGDGGIAVFTPRQKKRRGSD